MFVCVYIIYIHTYTRSDSHTYMYPYMLICTYRHRERERELEVNRLNAALMQMLCAHRKRIPGHACIHTWMPAKAWPGHNACATNCSYPNFVWTHAYLDFSMHVKRHLEPWHVCRHHICVCAAQTLRTQAMNTWKCECIGLCTYVWVVCKCVCVYYVRVCIYKLIQVNIHVCVSV
jgi:hypothetical protein